MFQRSAGPGQPPTMKVGGSLVIGTGEKFVSKELIGQGSFGCVWRMEAPSQVLALKETISDSEQSFHQNLTEAFILQHATNLGAEGIPNYLGHEGARLDSRTWRVRTLMTLLPGVPLDKWLSQEPPGKGGLAGAVAETTRLLKSLATTLKTVDKIAVHRDVNSHNVLVCPAGESVEFYLIDFGLAVENARWKQEGGWKKLPLAGDCKYWPPCAWLMFILGPQALETDQWRQRQYRDRLDLFSLAVTCLEFFFKRASKADVSGELREAWRAYWAETSHCWELFYSTFKRKGDWEALRRQLKSSFAFESISAKLAALTANLHKSGGGELGLLFGILKDMLTADSDEAGDFSKVLTRLTGSSGSVVVPRVVTTPVSMGGFRPPSFKPMDFTPSAAVIADFRSPVMLTRTLMSPQMLTRSPLMPSRVIEFSTPKFLAPPRLFR